MFTIAALLLTMLYHGWTIEWQGWREIDQLGHYGGYFTAVKGNKKLYAAYPGGEGPLPPNFISFKEKKGQTILCHLESEEEMKPYKNECFERLLVEINKEEKKKCSFTRPPAAHAKGR